MDSKYLLSKYCPNLFALLIKRKYQRWHDLNSRLSQQISSGKQIRTNLVALLLKVETESDPFLKAFAHYIDNLIGEILKKIPQKERRIWNSLNGKFDNIQDWNFLNPIGEFSILKKVLDSGTMELIEMEAPFPNGKPKDFLFKQKNDGKEVYVEVVNIHIPENLMGTTEIKEHLVEKLIRKINSETENVTNQELLKSLVFAPVAWYLETELLKSEYGFFSEFNESSGKNYGIKRRSLGFCTYVKTTDNRFIFGEASSIIDKYQV